MGRKAHEKHKIGITVDALKKAVRRELGKYSDLIDKNIEGTLKACELVTGAGVTAR